MAARTSSKYKEDGKTLLQSVWETEFWQGIKGRLAEIAEVDPTLEEPDLATTTAVFMFFDRIPDIKLAGPAERALEIFKIEQAMSRDSADDTSEGAPDEDGSSFDSPGCWESVWNRWKEFKIGSVVARRA